METRDLNGWDDFEAALRSLRASAQPIEAIPLSSKLLFRGQSDAAWELLSTLERRVPHPMSWQNYMRLVRSTTSHVQTFTDRTWTIPQWHDVRDWGHDYDDQMKEIPAYDYWVYLRHHGFPSPLLDWSRSPYVGAFFAFRNATAQRVAIYCYQETSTGGKGTQSDLPQISVHGPYVSAHQRHILQQCTYTTCSIFREQTWFYTKHSSVFELGEADQDRLWKFTIPTTERLRVLKHLDEYNLNAYSLFPTEDALLETVALRELEYRDR